MSRRPLLMSFAELLVQAAVLSLLELQLHGSHELEMEAFVVLARKNSVELLFQGTSSSQMNWDKAGIPCHWPSSWLEACDGQLAHLCVVEI